MTSALTAMLERKSARGAQLTPPLVLFQTPPATPAAYMIRGSVGWMSRARVLPPTLPGPRLDQPVSEDASATEEIPGPAAARDGRTLRFGVEYRGMLSIFRSAAR